jgi:hypothetical protein
MQVTETPHENQGAIANAMVNFRLKRRLHWIWTIIPYSATVATRILACYDDAFAKLRTRIATQP